MAIEVNKTQYGIKESFLEAWPLDRVKDMNLEEYTDLEKEDSFTYWVESRTRPLGSIQGGTSYKFGIYKRDNTEKEDSRNAYLTDGEYGWLRKYGESKEEAFENVKQIVLLVVEASIKDNLNLIDGLDLGDAYKWKISFLYSNYRVMNILSTPNIRWVGEYKGFDKANTAPISEIHRFLTSNKPTDLDFYDYSKTLWSALSKMKDEEGNVAVSRNDKSFSKMNLNQILYGPPGTGKTYHTINKALQIVDPEFYKENHSDRKALNGRFKQLLFDDRIEKPKDWRIAFTTFHQSFSYEDFVEGIKPVIVKEGQDLDESFKDLRYRNEPGIFKIICDKARYIKTEKKGVSSQMVSLSENEFKESQFYKISLGNSNNEEDNAIYEYCIDNSKIAIGHLDGFDLTHKTEREIKEVGTDNPELSMGAVQMMNYFVNYLKIGNYVIVSNGNKHVRAIGKVTGEYEYNIDSDIRYPHFRSVEWLIKDKNIPVEEVYGKDFQMQPIYSLKKEWINPEFFKSKETNVTGEASQTSTDNFVLIIDEINRGNISQIFGELITLIEKDKREGEDEELSAILPYSKDKFTVPSNVYVIGTMNTADKSIEALDTALRRRFVFEEMPPIPNVIVNEGELKDSKGELKIGSSSFSLSEILKTINVRVNKLLDKDHLIGHSYFMKVKTCRDLQIIFKRNIIPLLEEYFYGDLGKIQLVLGRGFIKQAPSSGDVKVFSDSDYEDSIFGDREIWEITAEWMDNETDFEKALTTLLVNKA